MADSLLTLHGSGLSRASFPEISSTYPYYHPPSHNNDLSPRLTRRRSGEPGCNGFGFYSVSGTRRVLGCEPGRYVGGCNDNRGHVVDRGEEVNSGANDRARRGALRGWGDGVRQGLQVVSRARFSECGCGEKVGLYRLHNHLRVWGGPRGHCPGRAGRLGDEALRPGAVPGAAKTPAYPIERAVAARLATPSAGA